MNLLPKEKSKPKPRLSDYTILIYGAPKVGKTTFVSRFNKVIFAATEEGYGALSVFAVSIDTWEKFLEFCKELAEADHDFENVCIDTVDNLLQLCATHILGKHQVEHESDLDYGKGYALVLNEFIRAMTKLSHLPYGLILVSHQESEAIQTRTEKYNKAVASLRGKARKAILGMCDFILFFSIKAMADNTLERIIQTKPSKFHDAGDRTGFLPEEIPLNHTLFMREFETALKKLVAGERPSANSQEKKEIPPAKEETKTEIKTPPAEEEKKKTDKKTDKPADQANANKPKTDASAKK